MKTLLILLGFSIVVLCSLYPFGNNGLAPHTENKSAGSSRVVPALLVSDTATKRLGDARISDDYESGETDGVESGYHFANAESSSASLALSKSSEQDTRANDDEDTHISGSSLRQDQSGVGRENSDESSSGSTGHDDYGMARQFLVAAFEVARQDSPELAAAIEKELLSLDNSTGRSDPVLEESSPLDVPAPSSSGGGTRDVETSDGEPADDAGELEEEADSQSDPVNDYSWCGSGRPEASPGVFRCPCPGDKNYFPKWRSVYNEGFLRGMGCI